VSQVPSAAVLFNRHICAAGDPGASVQIARKYILASCCCVAVVWLFHSRSCRCTASQAVSLVFFLLPNAYILANGQDAQQCSTYSNRMRWMYVRFDLLPWTCWPPAMHDRRMRLV
jgi:hypothetical protein